MIFHYFFFLYCIFLSNKCSLVKHKNLLGKDTSVAVEFDQNKAAYLCQFTPTF